MAITTEILRTWVRPRETLRRQMAMGQREDRALILLMAACFLMFVAQLPLLSRIAFLSEQSGTEVLSFQQLAGTAFFAWLLLAPLAFYLVAGIAHLLCRALGIPSTGFSGRMALFWALLAATPAALLLGLVQGLIGPGLPATIAGFVWIGAIVVFWVQGARGAASPVMP